MSDVRTASAPQVGYAVPAVLELRGVSKVYESGPAEVHALRQADLSVGAGSMVAVMGPSGSGKSTLLTIAGSLEDPASGEVLVEGVPLSGMSRGAKARLRRRHHPPQPAARRIHRRLAVRRAPAAGDGPATARMNQPPRHRRARQR